MYLGEESHKLLLCADLSGYGTYNVNGAIASSFQTGSHVECVMEAALNSERYFAIQTSMGLQISTVLGDLEMLGRCKCVCSRCTNSCCAG